MGYGGLENAVVVCFKLVVAAIDAHENVSFQNIEGFLVEMHMFVQSAACIELAEAQAGMYRAGGIVVNQGYTRVFLAVLFVIGRDLESRFIVVFYVMHDNLLSKAACQLFIPAMRASTSNITAKSSLAIP